MAPTERYRLQRGAPLETNRYVREVLEEKGAEVKIAVAFKVVPDDQDIQVASDGTLDFSKAKGTVSTYDLNALEAAAQLAAANPGSTVTAVTVGAASIDDSKLKKNVLARGVDDLVMVADDALAALDTAGTAEELAAIVGEGGFDLILCGDGSADEYAQQVDVQLAARLGVPSVNAVTAIKAEGDSMVVERTLEDVVEEVDNPDTEISLEEARRSLPHVQLGDVVSSEIKPKNFGRIAAQTARQVIIQGIREAERNMIYDEFVGKTQELLTGVVTRIDPRNGALHVKIGTGRESTEALLTAGEQVRGESYREGDRIKVYVVEVRRTTRGTQVVISRTHYGLVRRLFEMEVPEIYDGVVEIRSIAREAGSRTKMAVWSNDPEVDPIGACVGTRGARVNAIVEELNGEKVDIIKYSEDPAEFISAALSPADVIDVRCNPEEKTCRVIVPDDQLSLAIGKEGQNARLAAKLTGYKIDIKSESNADEVDEEELLDAVEPEEDDLLAEDSNALLDDGADVAEAQDAPAEEPEAEEEAAVEPAEDAEEAEE